jgi:4'-phosphopantetheinyl transferase
MPEQAVAVDVVVAPLQFDAAAQVALLTRDERQRAARFARERDRRRFIAARALLRQLLATRLGAAAESIELITNAFGKPALARNSGAPDLRFNLSHCGDLAVYAFAEAREVGVDIEAVRALDDADAIAARSFSKSEYQAYRALPERERPLGFFYGWTRKEAFVKARGSGLSQPLDGFDVSLAPAEPARILRVGRTPGARCGWTLRSLFPAPGFIGALVVEQ